jgi:hypothetical protein
VEDHKKVHSIQIIIEVKVEVLEPHRHTPHSLKDLNVSPKMKIIEEEGVGVCSLICNISRVVECVGAPRWGL